MSQTIIFLLNDAARITADQALKQALKSAALELDKLIDDLCKERSHEAMTTLNGAWARAANLLKPFRETPDPVPPLTDAVSPIQR